ncbi:hypothetical protein [Lacipirellula sp.]|uniref:hypothetical protein n=1 Tax=Lacipirellula sp. TaxID=2691419 RepID=UPI003D0EC863
MDSCCNETDPCQVYDGCGQPSGNLLEPITPATIRGDGFVADGFVVGDRFTGVIRPNEAE